MIRKTKTARLLCALLTGAIAISIASFTLRPAKVSLVKKWETEAQLKVPESVIYDEKNNVIYAANIDGEPWGKDGKGFISRISPGGKIEKLEWITGLDAPKGMGIYKGKLYIADITKVAVADIATGKIEKNIEVKGATNLNDITIDAQGNVYVSDSGGKYVYVIKNGTASVWKESSDWKKPNGVLALKNSLRVVDHEDGIFYDVPYATKTPKATAKGLTKGDGIVEIGPDEFLVSSWLGEIFYVKGDKVEKVLDTKDAKENSADIWYIPSQKLVLVPTFFGNKVVAYQLNKE